MLVPWKKSYATPRQHIKKQRHNLADKGPYSQSYGFSSSYIWMWELNHEEDWAPKMFWTVGLEKTLERPLNCKKIKSVNSKGNSPEYSLEDLILKLKLQYFGHLMWRTESLEKTLMLGKTEGRKRRGWQKMRWLDGITDSMDVNWGSPRRWWWTRKPGCFSPWGRKQLDMAEWLNTQVTNYPEFLEMRKL